MLNNGVEMNRLHQVILMPVMLTLLFAFNACSEDAVTSRVKAEVEHFKKAQKLYFDASRYLSDITSSDSMVGSMRDDELNAFIEKLSNALKEAKLVSDNTLQEIHSELPNAYHSIFIACIEQQIRGFRDFDRKASIEGQMLHDVWIDWWNGHYKEFKNF